jgi:hypothetical protein
VSPGRVEVVGIGMDGHQQELAIRHRHDDEADLLVRPDPRPFVPGPLYSRVSNSEA